MRARFIRQVGIRGKLRIYWDSVTLGEVQPCADHPDGHAKTTYLNACPNTYGTGKPGFHNAYTPLGEKPEMDNWFAFGKVEDYPEERWPTACAHCGAPVPQESPNVYLQRQVAVTRLYDNPSGEPEPGDVYWMDWHDPGECPYWENCDGKHLWSIVPNGSTWDIDARANNCTMREEKTHRCWIRTGTPEAGNLHVDKNGYTCAAGAGSIAVTGWHGFLHGFTWNGC